MLVSLLFSAVLAQAPAIPDRSGEPALREVMSWAAGLDHVHLIVYQEARDAADAPMYPGARVDVYLDKPRFRLETSGYWGDGSLFVSDGTTVLWNQMSEWSPAVLAPAKGSLLDCLADVKPGIDDVSPFFLLMKGPAELDKLVKKDEAIQVADRPGGESVVTFNHAKLGRVRLHFHRQRKGLWLDSIDYNNLPQMVEMYNASPEDWDHAPDPEAVTRDTILMAEPRFPRGCFDTRPPLGQPIEDRRKKATKSPEN